MKSILLDLYYEIGRRAEKECADDGNDFNVTISYDMWKSLKEVI